MGLPSSSLKTAVLDAIGTTVPSFARRFTSIPRSVSPVRIDRLSGHPASQKSDRKTSMHFFPITSSERKPVIRSSDGLKERRFISWSTV